MRRRLITGWTLATLLPAACGSTGGAGSDGGGEADATADTTGDASDGGDVVPMSPPLLDELGRTVLYVGANVSGSSKSPPEFLPNLEPSDYDTLAGWGVTLVRFLVLWEAVEPSPGAHDGAYLAAVRAEVDAIAARGMQVFLDMHQDVFGRGFGFDGAPRWACAEERYASFRPMEPWFLNYLSPEVTACFDDLWTTPALWDAYRDAWARAAGAVADVPAVIGWDLMNEPAGGTQVDFERRVLLPFYERVAAGIEAVAPGRLFFLEPELVFNLGVPTRLRALGERRVFAPHYYPTFAETGDYDGDREALRADLAERLAAGGRTGAPILIGEFGTRAEAGNADLYLADVLDGALETGVSATVWDAARGSGGFALLQADGTPQPFARSLVRPYPHRIAGRLLSTTYDRDTETLSLAWEETGIAAPTVIVVPASRFAAVDVGSTDPPGSWTSTHDPTLGRLELTVDPAVRSHAFRIAPR